ncbi:IclR family transcriptional regulator [Bacillus benzoevorans]|uniref:DNA-binding IclR family transcriptional regulator n=1 Tax=Bacillus benzoevorans TaxID=1456 RepID=A0A7X0LXJ1_9BACI|nr:IclR family transcriptional regulator [Bacillus benzoevorans]MBB6446562.1 DNA-binding IclR family transcriptional regulator [Bacillus benzoevorans]
MRYPAVNEYHYSSFRNALRLLNLFSVNEPELQLEDMACRLEIGQSTAYRLVHTLMEEGFIVRDVSAKSYRLAASFLAYSHTIITKVDLCDLSLDIVEKLAETTGETAHISVFKDDEALYLLKIDSSYPVHLLSHAGRKNPLHCTSTGQVLLACQPDFIIEQVIKKGLTSYTSKTITDPIKLKNVLQTIRTQGYAVSKEELHEGVVSIAAPVKNKEGKVIAVISIAGPNGRINLHTIPKLIKQVQQAADEVTKKFQSRKR